MGDSGRRSGRLRPCVNLAKNPKTGRGCPEKDRSPEVQCSEPAPSPVEGFRVQSERKYSAVVQKCSSTLHRHPAKGAGARKFRTARGCTVAQQRESVHSTSVQKCISTLHRPPSKGAGARSPGKGSRCTMVPRSARVHGGSAQRADALTHDLLPSVAGGRALW